MNITTLRISTTSAAVFLACAVFAQQGSTPQNGENPVAPTNVAPQSARVGDPNTPQDGSTVLGPTYQASMCGLNYVTASNKIGKRISPAGGPHTATFAIAGIPATANIQKAYVWCDASGNGVAINLNVTNPLSVSTSFAMANIG